MSQYSTSGDSDAASDVDLDCLLDRINQLTSQTSSADAAPQTSAHANSKAPTATTETTREQPSLKSATLAPKPTPPSGGPPRNAGAENPKSTRPGEPSVTGGFTGDEEVSEFFPEQPTSFADAGLNAAQVEELVLKYVMNKGEDSGSGIAAQVKLPFAMISELLSRMKYDQLIQYRGTTSINDYVCQLTDLGRERARRLTMTCTYFGSAPVGLDEYWIAIRQQSLQYQSPSEEDLNRAFSDLLINPKMLLRLGTAANSGRGMFLFGYPGNGKTSIAERITKAFGEYIWIPRAIGIDGDVIRLYDPSQHEAAPEQESDGLMRRHKLDERWVRIRRPTIVVGGELTMDNLELSTNSHSGINEAPVQLKSNCGTLVIDDFGRQRMSTDELLNRWIVPLEKRYDFLNLPSGKKIQVPFDQLVVFSTNLEPKDLVDDAFLRRIPYKIEVENPTEVEFRKLFEIMCPIMGFDLNADAVNYLIDSHYKPIGRPFRCCQPRDLLLQIINYCKYRKLPRELNRETVDFAVMNYFAVM